MALLNDFLAEVRCDVDETLNDLIPPATATPVRLHEAIRWSVFAGGKRIRPAVLVAVGRTFGAATSLLLRAAAAVEMIHTYSLIHDDLPAMDDDDLRRGRATCHRQFGDATAILAGDVLQTLAFKAIADEDALDAKIRIKLISMLADASGTPNGMVSGQQLDLDGEGKELSIIDLEQIHRQKTGALIRFAAAAGAAIGEVTPDEMAAIENYAANLGLLFQITDDLLDVTQATEMLGKTAGKDASASKATYPGHYGVEATRAMADEIFRKALGDLSSIQRDTTLLSDLAAFVFGRTK